MITSGLMSRKNLRSVRNRTGWVLEHHCLANNIVDGNSCIGETMQEYRIYTLDKDGKIGSPPEVIECEDDSAAFEHARQLLNGTAVEVWQTARRVGRLEPTPAP
jgi:hypothetical protein